MLRQRFTRWPSIEVAVNQRWLSVFHICIHLLYCSTLANTRRCAGAGGETDPDIVEVGPSLCQGRVDEVCSLGGGGGASPSWQLYIDMPKHFHSSFLNLILMHTYYYLNWLISLMGWVPNETDYICCFALFCTCQYNKLIELELLCK